MNCLFFFVGLVTSVETFSDPMMGLTLFTSSGVSLRQPLAANFQSSESSLRTRKSLTPKIWEALLNTETFRNLG